MEDRFTDTQYQYLRADIDTAISSVLEKKLETILSSIKPEDPAYKAIITKINSDPEGFFKNIVSNIDFSKYINTQLQSVKEVSEQTKNILSNHTNLQNQTKDILLTIEENTNKSEESKFLQKEERKVQYIAIIV
jgi:hypothetical protein